MRALWAVLVAVPLIAGTVLAETVQDKEAKAVNVATQWLQLCDMGRYNETWDAAASYFQNAIKKNQWRQMAAAARDPLGKLVKRSFRSQEYRTTIPGGPDGEYVILQFDTSFLKKNEAVETVTVMLDQNRGWRVAGYYIK